jgi:hypothetical protein
VRDRIADFQRLHDAIGEFRDETVQWGLGNLGRISRTALNSASQQRNISRSLRSQAMERRESSSEVDEEIGKAVGDMLLGELQVLELLLVVSVHGHHLGESSSEVDERSSEKRSIGDSSSKLQNDSVHTS